MQTTNGHPRFIGRSTGLLPAVLAASILGFAATAAPQTGPDQWSDPPGAPTVVAGGGGVVAPDANTLYALFGGGTTGFSRCTPSPFPGTWTALSGTGSLPQAPWPISDGAAMAFLPETTSIYVLRGGATKSFSRYNTVANSWTNLPDLPENATTSCALAAAAGNIYAMAGAAGNFFEFIPSTSSPFGAWAAKAVTPAARGFGCALAYPDTQGDYLYALRGANSSDFWRYAIGGPEADTWIASIAPVPQPVGMGGTLGSAIAGALVCTRGYGSTDFYAYVIGANAWVALGALPGIPGTGAGISCPGAGNFVHFLRGASTRDIWSYYIPAGTFSSTLAPISGVVPTGDGGALTSVGNGNDLYALVGEDVLGRNSTSFKRYSIADNRWTDLAPAPQPVGAGGSLAYPGGDHIYASRGAGTTEFWRYSISGNTWSVMAPVPGPMGSSGQIVHGGGNRIYAVRGAALLLVSPNIFLYTLPDSAFPLGRWEQKAALPAPETFSIGAALVCPGPGDLIYAFMGGAGSKKFRRYSISGDSWSSLADVPLAPGQGATLAYPGGGSALLALLGSSSSTLYSFSITSGQWTRKADAPGTVGPGASFAYSGGGPFLHALQGNRSRTLWRYRFENGPATLAEPTLRQFRLDASTRIGPGEVTIEPGFVVVAGVDDPDIEPLLQLQVEVKPVGVPFTGIPTASSPPGGSGLISLPVTGLPLNGAYHWQVRADDGRGGSSPWVSFGSNPDIPSEIDFQTRSEAAPTASAPAQLRPSNGAPVAGGGWFADEDGVTFEASVSDADHDLVRLEVEVRPVGTAFSNVATSAGLPTAGAAASVRVPFLGGGSYHWQCRGVDAFEVPSPWTAFGSNPEESADFRFPGGSLGKPAGEVLRPHANCFGAASDPESPAISLVVVASIAAALLRRKSCLVS